MKRKVLSVILASSMLINLTGCLDGNSDGNKKKDKEKDEVDVEELEDNLLDVADDFCKAVSNAEYKKISKLMYDADDDAEEQLADLYSFDDEEFGLLYQTIADTIEYELDKKSAEVKESKGKGSIEVTFDLIDYDSLNNENSFSNVDSYIAAINSATERISVDLEITFKLDDDEWYVTNAEDVVSGMTFYRNFKPSFTPSLIDCIDYVEWYGSVDNVYDNVNWIELDIIPNLAGYEADWTLKYEVYHDGILVYTSKYFTDTSLSYIGGCFDANCNSSGVDDEGFLIEGEYTVVFYDINENEVARSTCKVTRTPVAATPTETGSDEGVFDMNYLAALVLATRDNHPNVDPDFLNNYYSDSYWFDYCDSNGNSTMLNEIYYDYETNPYLGYVLETRDYEGALVYTLCYIEDLSIPYTDLLANSDLYYIDYGYLSNDNGGNYYSFDYPYEVNKGAYMIFISPDDASYKNSNGGDFYMFDIAVVQ
ncbi:MAG: hypothetical protein MJ172_01960 [Clostridia bacterium]|nr:hypothetical protein [Clostridia bacterium]